MLIIVTWYIMQTRALFLNYMYLKYFEDPPWS